MIKRALGLGIFALFGSLAAYGQGTLTVSFNHSVMDSPGVVWGCGSYNESSMIFNPLPGSVAVWLVGQNYAGCPDDHSTFLQGGYGDNVAFSSLAAPTFAIKAVDLAEFSTVTPDPSTVKFIGYRADGSTISTSFTTDGIADGRNGAADFQTFNFDASWTDLTHVEVAGADTPGHGWSMDNLVVAVPEPSMGALFVVGALASRFRKMKQARTK